MKRRDFLGVFGGGIAAWPLIARAQQANGRKPKIVFLAPAPQTYQDEFTRGLREFGWINDVNSLIQFRFDPHWTWV